MIYKVRTSPKLCKDYIKYRNEKMRELARANLKRTSEKLNFTLSDKNTRELYLTYLLNERSRYYYNQSVRF